MKLDVGCGAYPRGDVNVDLFVGATPHSEAGWVIMPKKIPNFVRCDANELPFKDKVFSESFCSHLIEHKGVKPIRLIKEMLRVTNGNVELRIPHRIWDRGRCKAHARSFNKSNVVGLLRSLGLAFDLKLFYDFLPHTYIPILRLPREIRVTIFNSGFRYD